MIMLACEECGLALRTSGDFEEVDILIGTRSGWYPNNYPCPRADCKSRMMLTENVESSALPQLELVELTPQEVFAALNGMGLPREKDCGLQAVTQTLMGQTIESIDAIQMRGANRTVLHSLRLSNGSRVFIAASPAGAIIYRIAEKRSYVEEATNGNGT